MQIWRERKMKVLVSMELKGTAHQHKKSVSMLDRMAGGHTTRKRGRWKSWEQDGLWWSRKSGLVSEKETWEDLRRRPDQSDGEGRCGFLGRRRASSLDPPSVNGLSPAFVQLENWAGRGERGEEGAPLALVHLPDCAESRTLSLLWNNPINVLFW